MSQTETHSAPGPLGSRPPPLDLLQSRVDGAAAYGIGQPAYLEVLADAPYTILVSPHRPANYSDLGATLQFIAGEVLQRSADAPEVLFRSVELSRLHQVIHTGCDVVPSNAPLFASQCASKALEYGGPEKVVMVFDPARLEKTFKKVRKSEPPEFLDQLRADYPSAMELNQEWIWLSKLPPGDGRIGTAYETECSFFIPGKPHEALLMLFLTGNDRNMLQTEFLRHTTR